MHLLLILESQPTRRLLLRRFLEERGHSFRMGGLEELEELGGVTAVLLDPTLFVRRRESTGPIAELGGVPVIWTAPAPAAATGLPEPIGVLEDPRDLARLESLLESLVESLVGGSSSLAPAGEEEAGASFVAEDPASRRLLQDLDRLAAHDISVLLQGESGTGKEILARELHLRGPRRDEPFLAVHCGAIPAELLESELFGHEKGSFTDAHRQHRGPFERAGRGTVFLDEIGEMPLELQPKLLRVLEERRLTRVGGETSLPVHARVVTATHRNLPEALAQGSFRRDLYHRLAVATLEIPPLRDRPADLRALTRLFLRRFAVEQGVPARELSAGAWRLFQAHPWPGNVRELENVLRRALLLQRGPVLEQSQFPELSPPRAIPGGLSGWATELHRWLRQRGDEGLAPSRVRRAVREEVERILEDWSPSEGGDRSPPPGKEG